MRVLEIRNEVAAILRRVETTRTAFVAIFVMKIASRLTYGLLRISTDSKRKGYGLCPILI